MTTTVSEPRDFNMGDRVLVTLPASYGAFSDYDDRGSLTARVVRVDLGGEVRVIVDDASITAAIGSQIVNAADLTHLPEGPYEDEYRGVFLHRDEYGDRLRIESGAEPIAVYITSDVDVKFTSADVDALREALRPYGTQSADSPERSWEWGITRPYSALVAARELLSEAGAYSTSEILDVARFLMGDDRT